MGNLLGKGKEMRKDIIQTLLIVVVIVIAVLTYPFFIKVEDGTMTCSNLLGQEVKCRG